jgi:hypothetical protein
MASYADWNKELINYFTEGVEKGSRVYLSVDDDVLERIGKKFNPSASAYNWRDDFCCAVKRKLGVTSVNGGNQIDLIGIKDSVSSPPPCVAFLGITVLAAYDMASDINASVDERNYYRRFREALNLTTSESSAPRGMVLVPRIEPILWNRWSNWLQDHNFVPTALQGSSVTTRYIGYAISQSILRKADKEKIYKLVQEQGLFNHWNIDSLMDYLYRNIENLTPHLRDLLTGSEDDRRLDVIRKAVKDALEKERTIQLPLGKQSIDIPRLTQKLIGSKKTAHDNGEQVLNYDLSAQVCRTEGEDPFYNQYPTFHLYPKQKSGVNLLGANVLIDGVIPLPTLQKSDLESWYLPIFEHLISPINLSQGAKYQITQCQSSTSHPSWLTLDKRDFWLLTPDPDCPESGIYGSFGKIILGQPFILLCKKELIASVERLQREQLLRFNDVGVKAFESDSDWFEFQQCMILSEDWEGVDLGWEGKELKEALQPAKNAAIIFTGGLYVPHLRAWLIDDVPILTVFSTIVDRAEVIISVTGKPSSKRFVSTNTPNTNVFENDGDVQVGEYDIQVICGKFSSRKSVRLVDWKDLEIREPVRKELFQISNWNVNGSQVCPLVSGENTNE